MFDDEGPNGDGPADILYLVDRLEELVGVGKRVPFSGRVMVEEEHFLALVDQLRIAVPDEIKKAQKVIRERQQVIADAHEEAKRVVDGAKKRAEYLASQEGIIAVARQEAEQILRTADEGRKRALGEVDAFALQRLDEVEDALRNGLAVIDSAVRETVEVLTKARESVGK